MMKFEHGDRLFFTSDTHFGHKKILEYQPNRDSEFGDIDEMAEQLIKRWNDKVSPEDTVFHLGDFAFLNATKSQWVLSRLNGKIHLVNGNHDHFKMSRFLPSKEDIQNKVQRVDVFQSIRHYREIRVGKQVIVLFHFPIHDWNMTSHGSWHFHGHTHGTHQGPGKSQDVGIDTHPDFCPYSFAELVPMMERKEIKYHYENEK